MHTYARREILAGRARLLRAICNCLRAAILDFIGDYNKRICVPDYWIYGFKRHNKEYNLIDRTARVPYLPRRSGNFLSAGEFTSRLRAATLGTSVWRTGGGSWRWDAGPAAAGTGCSNACSRTQQAKREGTTAVLRTIFDCLSRVRFSLEDESSWGWIEQTLAIEENR